MNLLIVCQLYYPENVVITNIAEELVKKGHEVHVLTGLPNYGFDHILEEYKDVREEEINGVKVHRVKIYAKQKDKFHIIANYMSYWYNAKRWVRKCKIKFDVVYSMSLSPVTILAPANLYKKKYHVKHVCHCVDLWPESVLVTNAVKKDTLFYKILYKWSKSLYGKVDQIIIGSPSYEQYFKNVLKLNNDNTVFIPQPPLASVDSPIAPHKYEQEGFHILYCGNIGRIQMVEDIPEAMSLVKKDNVYFDIIGMGPLTDKLKENIIKYHVEDKVFYHGPIVARLSSAYFKSADALYVSLNSNGYVGKTIPNKLVMSMAFKKPILANLDGDGAHMLLKSGGGILLDEQNPANLALKIEKIADLDNKVLNTMGEKNYRYYLDNFHIDSVSDKIEKVLLANCVKESI